MILEDALRHLNLRFSRHFVMLESLKELSFTYHHIAQRSLDVLGTARIIQVELLDPLIGDN